MKIPLDGIFKLEHDLELLREITKIDFSNKFNTSNSSQLSSSIGGREYEILNKIYAKDFSIGNYKKQTV